MVFSRLRISCTFLWVVLALFFHDTLSLAQCPSTVPNLSEYGTGTFSIRKISADCIPVTVSLKSSLPGSTNIKNVFDFRGGAIHPDSLTTDSTYTYSKPGIYTILQFSEIAGRKLITCPKVYVPDTLPPKVRLLVCGGISAKIEFDRQTFEYYSYSIDWGDGTADEILPYIKKVSHTYPTPNPYTIKVWGFQNDNCRSNDAILEFRPSTVSEKPTIDKFKVISTQIGELTITNPLKTQILLFRKTSRGAWESTGRTLNQQTETLQVSLDSLVTSCFKVEAIDSCLSNSYTSEESCSSSLQLKEMPRQNEISWVSESANAKVSLMKDGTLWKDLSTLGRKGDLLDEELICASNHCYQLIVETATTRFTSLPKCRNTPSIICGQLARLHIPDAFSPNGDGINDYFEIKGNQFTGYEITIYNLWGSVIFNATDTNNRWDGTMYGIPLPAATYVYKIKITDPVSGDKYIQNGSIKIIR